MRVVILAAALAVSLTTASAQVACFEGASADVLAVSDWKIEPINERTNLLSVTLQNLTGRTITMVDASFRFSDALGGIIGPAGVDRDVNIAPGASHLQTGRWGTHTFERLLNLNPDQVSAGVCVKSVLFDDGTIERFGPND